MAFPPKVVEDLLVACERHCCLCHKPCGVNIEVHHIVPVSEGGDDFAANAIALCFDCHADVEHYNARHPRGRKYTPNELRRRRDQHIDFVRSRFGIRSPVAPPAAETTTFADVLSDIDRLELWDPGVLAQVAPRVLQVAPPERPPFIEQLARLFDTPTDRVRWNAALVVELLVQWAPPLISDRLLARMAADDLFSVRSSAAVSYYWLSSFAPERVPVETLRRLASYYEDWYVMTPATSALVRLGRVRSVAIDALAAELTDPDPDARSHSAEALRKLVRHTLQLPVGMSRIGFAGARTRRSETSDRSGAPCLTPAWARAIFRSIRTCSNARQAMPKAGRIGLLAGARSATFPNRSVRSPAINGAVEATL